MQTKLRILYRLDVRVDEDFLLGLLGVEDLDGVLARSIEHAVLPENLHGSGREGREVGAGADGMEMSRLTCFSLHGSLQLTKTTKKTEISEECIQERLRESLT